MTKRLDSSRGEKFALNVDLEAKLQVSVGLEAKTSVSVSSLISVSISISSTRSWSQRSGLGLTFDIKYFVSALRPRFRPRSNP